MSVFHLKQINIRNFRSIQKVDLEIKDGLYAIIGKNTDQASTFNGAGKSSTVYALWWCLTGSSLGGEVLADDVVNIQAGKDCKVECVFDTDQGEVIITRYRKDKEFGNNLFLTINGQDLSCHKVAETQERINQLLKVNFDVLKSTIIMTSDIKARFSELNPQSRVALLESIRDYTIWEKVRAESNADIKDLDAQIKQNTSDINQMQGSINTYNNLIGDLRQKYVEERSKVNNDNPEEKIKALELQLSEKQKELQSCDEKQYNEAIILLDGKISVKNDYIQTLLAQHSGNNEKINQKYKEQTKTTNDSIQELQTKINNVKTKLMTIDFDVRTLQNDVSIIDKWFQNDTCPTCNRKLERTPEEITNKEKQKAELVNKITEKNNEEATLSEDETKTTTEKQKLEEILKNYEKNQSDELQAEKNNYETALNKIKNEINELEEQKKTQRSALETLNAKKMTLNSDIAGLQTQITTLKEQNKSVEEKLQEIQNQAAEYKKQVDELEQNKGKITEENAKLEKQREYVKFFYDSLGPKGNFRGILLAQDIAYINQCIKNYTPKFFSGVNLYLTTPSMEKNAIDIVFEEDGIVKPVSNLSSGERKRVDLQIQMAIYDLVQSTSLFNFNLCVFDEIESALDPEGVRQLLEVIDDRQDNFQTAWWITNNEMVSSNILNKIVATKKNGFTKLEYL
jgi:DNA repair exonuclease SbcCD ATPase subunit